MKIYFSAIVTVLLVLLLAACHTKQDIPAEKKYIPNPAFSVKGTAVYTTQWCGGARPPHDLQKFHYTARPVKNTTLILTHREHGAKITCETNEEGNFELTAGEGEWNMSISEDFYEPNHEAAGMEIPTECDKFYGVSYGRISVNSDTAGLIFSFSLQCNPCDPYGNMRP
jgi:hypothetical protein